LCDNCGWELEDNHEAEDVKGSEDKMAVFNVQTAWIQEGLRKTSEMIFPVSVRAGASAFHPAFCISVDEGS
jgi:hypothetical protein